MMRVRLIRVDFPEAGHSFTSSLFARPFFYESETAFKFYIIVERDLRAGKKAHRNIRLSHCSEAACDEIAEARGHQLVSDLAGRDATLWRL
jgi:hypothetical protein